MSASPNNVATTVGRYTTTKPSFIWIDICTPYRRRQAMFGLQKSYALQQLTWAVSMDSSGTF
jgi:hypothetical protein